MAEGLIALPVLGTLTWLVLLGGWTNPVRRLDLRPTGSVILLGVLSVAAAVYFFGPIGGAALVVSVMVHEFGHVAAFRVAGHEDATFRLIPLMGGVAISRRLPATQLHDFYITIMGPGICLVLMVAATVIDRAVEAHWWALSEFFWMLAAVTGALNFFNLLPLWPLDGGRIVRILTYTLSPRLAHGVTLAMSAALAVLALASQSVLLFFFALISAQSAMSAPQLAARQRALSAGQAVMGLAAYLAMLGAFGLGGWAILVRFV